MTVWRWGLVQHSSDEDRRLMAELKWTPRLWTGLVDGKTKWGQGPQGIVGPKKHKKMELCQMWSSVKSTDSFGSSPRLFFRLSFMEKILLSHWLGVLLCETIMKTKQWFGVCLLCSTQECSALSFFPSSCQEAASGIEPSQRRAQGCRREWLRDKTFRCCAWLVCGQWHEVVKPCQPCVLLCSTMTRTLTTLMINCSAVGWLKEQRRKTQPVIMLSYQFSQHTQHVMRSWNSH